MKRLSLSWPIPKLRISATDRDYSATHSQGRSKSPGLSAAKLYAASMCQRTFGVSAESSETPAAQSCSGTANR